MPPLNCRSNMRLYHPPPCPCTLLLPGTLTASWILQRTLFPAQVVWGLLVWTLHSCGMMISTPENIYKDEGFALVLLYQGISLCGYVILVFMPLSKWQRRPAAIFLGKFCLISVVTDVIGLSLIYWDFDAGYWYSLFLPSRPSCTYSLP